jgi:ABC-type glutathione transport system ATPase component
LTAWRLEGVSKSYDGASWLRTGPRHPAVRDVSLEVAAGERVGLIGESGSGKTTLARVGLGLVPRDAGRVELLGEDTTGWSPRRWRAARHEAQLLFQDPRAMLNPAMRLGTLLRESARLHDPTRDADAAAAEVLARVGLAGREDALPHQLSGGERRRAGIARLLLARPRLVVADELTAGLDAALKAELVELLLDRVGRDCAVVLISHDVPVVLWSCTRVLVMNDGAIVDRFATADVGRTVHHPHTVALLQASGLDVTSAGPAQRGGTAS